MALESGHVIFVAQCPRLSGLFLFNLALTLSDFLSQMLFSSDDQNFISLRKQNKIVEHSVLKTEISTTLL